VLEWSEEVTIILNFSYTMQRHTSTMTISLPGVFPIFRLGYEQNAIQMLTVK
jgi:hypothetical protein